MATVNPTRMELTRLKRRHATAVRGHKLLKDKRDEMVRQFILLAQKQQDLRRECDEALAKCSEHFADIGASMGQAAATEALIYPVKSAAIEVGEKNIMSVRVPTFKMQETSSRISLSYSMATAPAELDDAVLELGALTNRLIELAETQKACDMMADEIEKTRRRVNALEHVMIPELETQIHEITMKLDENERGTLNRLMKVKDMLEEHSS
ncbi:MAG: V-type ATP synthase subunit D [Oscillospiraceae bacterium]|jgi:V/A-type H+-transporting ATPase subunit D